MELANSEDEKTEEDALPNILRKVTLKKHGSKVKDDNVTKETEMNRNGNDTSTKTQTRIETDIFPAYKMNRKRRGIAIIINNENFDTLKGVSKRQGTDMDAFNLQFIFSKLGFYTTVHKDVSLKMFKQIFIKAAKGTNHEQNDCFVAAFLSHGDVGTIYATDGVVHINKIMELFRGDRCPSLSGKPKLFFFQACRGNKHEDPVMASGDVVDGQFEPEVEITLPTIPSGSDFLFCYSVAEGFYSHRDTWQGSWYIKELTETIKKIIFENSTSDKVNFLDILTLVNNKVALKKVEKTDDANMIGKKQMPCFLSMLTKKLYLTPPK